MPGSKYSKTQNLYAAHPHISVICLNHDSQDFVTMSCFPLRGDMKEMAWLLQQDEELQAILDQFFNFFFYINVGSWSISEGFDMYATIYFVLER